MKPPSAWDADEVWAWIAGRGAGSGSSSSSTAASSAGGHAAAAVDWMGVARSLKQNEVDGSTLLSLTMEDIEDELDIAAATDREALHVETAFLWKINTMLLCSQQRGDKLQAAGGAGDEEADLWRFQRQVQSVQHLLTSSQQDVASSSSHAELDVDALIAPVSVQEVRQRHAAPSSRHKVAGRHTSHSSTMQQYTSYTPTVSSPLRQAELRLVTVGEKPGSSSTVIAYFKQPPVHSRTPSFLMGALLGRSKQPGPPWQGLVKECVACAEAYQPHTRATASFTAPCGHSFCNNCFRKSHEAAMQDSSMIPVKCCNRPYDPDVAALVLKSDDFANFRRRYEERTCKAFMYCPRPTCSAFINIDCHPHKTHHRCHACLQEVCLQCKDKYHHGISCATFRTANQQSTTWDAAVYDLAEQQNWRRCERCGHMVELNKGCNHIACLCGYHFCYVCGDEWHTCGCPVWDEANVMYDAGQMVQREIAAAGPEAPALNPVQYEAQVRRAADHIRRYHDCQHSWRKDTPAMNYDCQFCGYGLWVYGFSCSICIMVACYTCRFHRLQRWS